MTAGSAKVRQQQERFARYCELRDKGVYPADVAREVGLVAGGSSAWAIRAGVQAAPGYPSGQERVLGGWA